VDVAVARLIKGNAAKMCKAANKNSKSTPELERD